MNFFGAHPYWTISLVSFLINIPLGYIRENCPKFSFKWLFWIHASIPLIVYLRLVLHTSKLFIPAAIILAILGQIIGSRYRRKMTTQEEREKLEQIFHLRIPARHSPKTDDRQIAVVLLNMGGPEDLSEVKPFLRRLFSDRLLIRFPLAFLFQPLMAFLLPTVREKATAHRYGLIGGKTPLLQSTTNQVNALEQEFKARGRNIHVTFCFNYSRPFPKDTIAEIKVSGRKYILPLSLYPHYSAATTGSNLFYLKKEAAQNYPEAIFLETCEYYLHDSYIDAFVERIQEQIKSGESLDDFYLLFSAHGLPLYFLTQGDPYPFQVAQTIAKILSRLNSKHKWAVSYQSAVGPLQWLKPSTGEMIKALARRGQRKLLVVPISFVNDHIETLCEIDIEYRALAKSLGIDDFRMSRALECHPKFIEALADCVEESIHSETQMLKK